MAHARFLVRYDHRWPSRSMTCYPAGWQGVVKREVLVAALAKGAAVDLDAEKAIIIPDDKTDQDTPPDGA